MIRVGTPAEQLWHRVPGGTARASVETLQALAELDGIGLAAFAAWHRASERHRGGTLPVPVTHIPVPRPLLYESWIRFDRPSVDRWIGSTDVVWASTMVPIATSAPLVVTVHDLEFLDNPAHNSRRGRRFFPRAWEAARRRASLLVCPSAVVAADVVRHGGDRDRVRVVPWGVTAAETVDAETVERVRRRHRLPDRFALWVGTLEPRKNVPRLVAALGALDDPIPLALVGPDGWSVDGDDVLGPLGDRAHRLGAVSDHDLAALYRAATVFVLPSLAEGFGLCILEAMAQGTPVVTSQATATAEVAGDAAVLVDPTDPCAIASGIAAVLADDGDVAAMIERGHRRVAAHTWAATAEGYAAAFRCAADGS